MPFNLTEAERNAPGGMSTIDGGVMTGRNTFQADGQIPNFQRPSPVAASSAPRQSPAAPQVDITGAPVLPAQNTQAETLAGIKTEALRIQDILNTRNNFDLSSGQSAEPEFTPFDEEGERKKSQRNQLALYQAEIDATNQVFDQLLNEARLQGQGRLGSQRASAARGGLLGSDFAGSQKNKVEGFNTDIDRGIQAQRTAAIGAIMGNVRSSVQTEIKDKREARQAGATEYLNFLTRSDARRDKNAALFATDFLSQGQNPADFTDEELTEMLQGSGVSKADLIRNYSSAKTSSEAAGAETALETRKTEAEISKIEADIAKGKVISLGEGTMLYNTETGEQFKNPKTYKPTAASGLSMGGQTLNQAQVAGVHMTLNESRGQDSYANTGTYMEEFNGFVNMGGDPKDFIKEYDPNVYINPADDTRSFLQAAMKKPASGNVFLGGLGMDFDSIISEAESEVGG